MGFQHMPKVVHVAASRKGGEINTKKGLAKLSPERRKAIASQGGKSGNQSRKGAKQTQESAGRSTPLLEAILGNIDGQ